MERQKLEYNRDCSTSGFGLRRIHCADSDIFTFIYGFSFHHSKKKLSTTFLCFQSPINSIWLFSVAAENKPQQHTDQYEHSSF